jgi:hypothetical protein
VIRNWQLPRRARLVGAVLLVSHGRLGDGVRHPVSRNRTEGKNVVMTALIETSSDRWTRMIRSTGVVGLVTFVVLFAAIIAMSLGEPAFTASPEEARAFYLNSTAGWVQAAMAVAGLAAIGWIWFVVGLCLLLGRATQYQRERRLVRCRRPRSGSGQLRLRCQLSRVGQRLARSGRFCGVLRLGGAVHSRRRSLAWLVGHRQRARARNLPFLLDIGSLASALLRLLDLDDHHVHPACPEATCGAERGRRASQPGR